MNPCSSLCDFFGENFSSEAEEESNDNDVRVDQRTCSKTKYLHPIVALLSTLSARRQHAPSPTSVQCDLVSVCLLWCDDGEHLSISTKQPGKISLLSFDFQQPRGLLRARTYNTWVRHALRSSTPAGLENQSVFLARLQDEVQRLDKIESGSSSDQP